MWAQSLARQNPPINPISLKDYAGDGLYPGTVFHCRSAQACNDRKAHVDKLRPDISEVELAFVTVPTAPSLKVTVLFAAIGSKPAPLIVIVVALAGSVPVLEVTSGVTVTTYKYHF